MPYESTHKFDIKVMKGKNKSIDMKIEKGKGKKLCFEKRGTYTLIPDSCYKFEKEKFEFNTTASTLKEAFVFKPTEYRVTGKVSLKDPKEIEKVKMTYH